MCIHASPRRCLLCSLRKPLREFYHEQSNSATVNTANSARLNFERQCIEFGRYIPFGEQLPVTRTEARCDRGNIYTALFSACTLTISPRTCTHIFVNPTTSFFLLLTFSTTIHSFSSNIVTLSIIQPAQCICRTSTKLRQLSFTIVHLERTLAYFHVVSLNQVTVSSPPSLLIWKATEDLD